MELRTALPAAVALAVLATLSAPLSTPAGAAPVTAVTPRPAAAAKAPTVDEKALTKKLRAYLATRRGSASVSFRDLQTGQWYTYRPGTKFATASVVKVDILAALLLRHQRAGTSITAKERKLASRMIRKSDNAATDVLWARIGGWKGLAKANRSLGMVATSKPLVRRWGSVQTTAADQVRLLRELSDPHSVLTKPSRDYVFTLMRRVVPTQRWGVPAAADRRTTAAVKDGWAPQLVDDGRWEINSIGRIRVDGRLVAVAILTRKNPDAAYGRKTAARLARLVGSAIRAAD